MANTSVGSSIPSPYGSSAPPLPEVPYATTQWDATNQGGETKLQNPPPPNPNASNSTASTSQTTIVPPNVLMGVDGSHGIILGPKHQQHQNQHATNHQVFVPHYYPPPYYGYYPPP